MTVQNTLDRADLAVANIDPWHLRECPPRSDWTDTQLKKHQSELLAERAALLEMNDPHTRLPRIEASLSRTETEMLNRLFRK